MHMQIISMAMLVALHLQCLMITARLSLEHYNIYDSVSKVHKLMSRSGEKEVIYIQH
jgi:hypothetical protein